VPSLRCKRSPYGQEVRFHPLPTILLRSSSFAGLAGSLERSRMPSEASAKEGWRKFSGMVMEGFMIP
jgi:hypothetical protein